MTADPKTPHKHAHDAGFAEALVNAYRNGNLIWKDK